MRTEVLKRPTLVSDLLANSQGSCPNLLIFDAGQEARRGTKPNGVPQPRPLCDHTTKVILQCGRPFRPTLLPPSRCVRSSVWFLRCRTTTHAMYIIDDSNSTIQYPNSATGIPWIHKVPGIANNTADPTQCYDQT
jgi:hypothetical protein